MDYLDGIDDYSAQTDNYAAQDYDYSMQTYDYATQNDGYATQAYDYSTQTDDTNLSLGESIATYDVEPDDSPTFSPDVGSGPISAVSTSDTTVVAPIDPCAGMTDANPVGPATPSLDYIPAPVSPTAAPLLDTSTAPVNVNLAPGAMADSAALPAEVVSRDVQGSPTHVRLNTPVNTTSMETFGGNGLNIGSIPAVSDPYADVTHVRVNTPVNPSITMETVGGITRAPSDLDYPAPGSAAAKGTTGIGPVHGQDPNLDVLTRTITGTSTERNLAGDITGHTPTNGKTYGQIGDAIDQQEKLRNGDPFPYSGPTKPKL